MVLWFCDTTIVLMRLVPTLRLMVLEGLPEATGLPFTAMAAFELAAVGVRVRLLIE